MDFEQNFLLVLIIPLGLIGLFILFHLLRFLQRRLKIFTRGTLTFMAASLLAFTLLDLLLLGHELRNNDLELRRDSQERLVVRVVRALVDDQPSTGLFELNSVRWREEFASTRQDLQSDLQRIEPSLGELENFKLISLDVRLNDFFDAQRLRNPLSRSWKVTGILVKDETTRVLTGHVSTRRDDAGRIQIESIALEMLDWAEAHQSVSMWAISSRADYHVGDYRYDSRSKSFRQRTK